MKKRFINDFRAFILFACIIIFFVVLLIFDSINNKYLINNFQDFVVYYGVFSIFIILSFIGLALSLEIIVFSKDQIIYLKLFKCIQIPYCAIECIRKIDKKGVGAGGIEPVWEIVSSGTKIHIVRTAQREKIIEQIEKQRLNKN